MSSRFALSCLLPLLALIPDEPWFAPELPPLPTTREPNELTLDVVAGEHYGAWFNAGTYTAREYAAHINIHSTTFTASLVDGKTVSVKPIEHSVQSTIVTKCSRKTRKKGR